LALEAFAVAFVALARALEAFAIAIEAAALQQCSTLEALQLETTLEA